MAKEFNRTCWWYFHKLQQKWFPCKDAWHAAWLLGEGDEVQLRDL